MKYSGHRKLLCELSSTDAFFLVYKFRPERTGFIMYAEYTQPQLTFLAFLPWIRVKNNFQVARASNETSFKSCKIINENKINFGSV